jgi:hypothetical protein
LRLLLSTIVFVSLISQLLFLHLCVLDSQLAMRLLVLLLIVFVRAAASIEHCLCTGKCRGRVVSS